MEEQISGLGPIMKAARKFKKLNHSAVASAIGCSQSALSKMEHNLLVPSAPQWFKFSRFTSIPPEAIERGVIDRHSVIKFNNQEISLGFKIPKRYRMARSIKIREVYPLLHALELHSPIQYKKFLEKVELDVEFFLDFDNLVNFLFYEDLLNFYVELGLNKQTDVDTIIQEGQNEIYWGEFRETWNSFKNPLQALEAYADKQPFYQMDFFIKVEGDEKRIFLSFYPEYHLNQLKLNSTQEQIQFLNLYRMKSIQHFLKEVFNRDFKISLQEETHASPLAVRFLIE
jgi:transcriptional regulator with XRE-family HTH domain